MIQVLLGLNSADFGLISAGQCQALVRLIFSSSLAPRCHALVMLIHARFQVNLRLVNTRVRLHLFCSSLACAGCCKVDYCLAVFTFLLGQTFSYGNDLTNVFTVGSIMQYSKKRHKWVLMITKLLLSTNIILTGHDYPLSYQ